MKPFMNSNIRSFKGTVWGHLAHFVIPVLILIISACSSTNKNIAFTKVESGFMVPPDSIQTSVYWYWISDNISKQGVINDLKAMKAVGINRAFIGNIGLTGEVPYGKVKLFSDEWWDI